MLSALGKNKKTAKGALKLLDNREYLLYNTIKSFIIN